MRWGVGRDGRCFRVFVSCFIAKYPFMTGVGGEAYPVVQSLVNILDAMSTKGK